MISPEKTQSFQNHCQSPLFRVRSFGGRSRRSEDHPGAFLPVGHSSRAQHAPVAPLDIPFGMGGRSAMADGGFPQDRRGSCIKLIFLRHCLSGTTRRAASRFVT